MTRQSPASARRVVALERRRRALELRIEGWTTTAIARELGVNRTTAWRLLDRALGELTAEIRDQAEQWRAVQARRLEEDIAHLRREAQAGDLGAYKTLRGLYERQARLLDLDLRREVETPERFVFEVEMRLPGERGETVEAAEVEEVPPPGLEPGDEGAEP